MMMVMMMCTFLYCRKVESSEMMTVTHHSRYCWTVMPAQEMNIKACLLVVLAQIIKQDCTLNFSGTILSCAEKSESSSWRLPTAIFHFAL